MSLEEKYRNVKISAISDATDGYGCVSTDIKALTDADTICGSAVTVWTMPGDKSYYEKLRAVVKAGDVVVIAAGGEMDLAAICSGMVRELKDAGVAGLIVDGAVMREPDVSIPVFAKAVHPKMLGAVSQARVNEPVSFGGAVVCPGDLIVGSADGLVVVQHGKEEETLDKAMKIMAEGQKKIAAIKE